MTKRDFLKTSGLGAAALLTDPLSALGARLPGRFVADAARSWLLPLFWSDDLVRLAHLSELPAPQLQALRANLELFHLGRAWDVTAADVLTLLTESRELLAAGEVEQDRALTQYALCSGHVAAGSLAAALPNDLTEAEAIAADAHLLRCVQAATSADPRTADPWATLTGVEERDVEALIAQIQQRTWLSTHTFRPEFSRAEQWIGEFVASFHAQRARNAAYASAYLRPDGKSAASLRALYRPDDLPVAMATALRGVRLTTERGKRAELLAASPTSVYGRQLQAAFGALETLGAYVAGEGSRAAVEALVG